MSSTPERSRVGDTLAGKYELEALLGVGGMGSVYRARNKLIGRTVAIKLLRAEHAANAETVQRFLREAKAANLVRHAHVVDVLDLGQDEDGTPFIVQEFLHGRDLGKYLEEYGGLIDPGSALALVMPVIDALAFAHAKGVVHRDIKPENIFLAQVEGRLVPKVLDFGISKIGLSSGPDLRVTDTGTVLGTPAYMSPEQIQGARRIDPCADVWALGVVLYELLAGTAPFHADSRGALFVQICTEDPVSLQTVAPRVPAELARIVHRCLRRNPAERYTTAAQLLNDLRAVRGGQWREPGRDVLDADAQPPTHARADASDATVAAGDEQGAMPGLERTSRPRGGARWVEHRGAVSESGMSAPSGLELDVDAAPELRRRASAGSGTAGTNGDHGAGARGGMRVLNVPDGLDATPALKTAPTDERFAFRPPPAAPPRGSLLLHAGALVLLVLAGAGLFGAVRSSAEGWDLLGWIFRRFPLGSPGQSAVVGLVLAAGGVVAADRGLRHTRASFGLLVVALGALALAFYLFATALTGAWVSLLNPGLRAHTFVPRDVGFALALPFAGAGVHALVAAVRGLRERDGGRRLLAAMALNLALAGLFIAVQITRGTLRAVVPTQDPSGWTDPHHRAHPAGQTTVHLNDTPAPAPRASTPGGGPGSASAPGASTQSAGTPGAGPPGGSTSAGGTSGTRPHQHRTH